MKLQIILNDQDKISNYNHVVCTGEPLDLSNVCDNECEEILANNILDMYTLEQVGQVVQQLVTKLRIGGEIAIGGTECRVFAKSIVNGIISESQASDIISQKKSMTNISIVKKALQQLGLSILSTSIEGISYEIKAKRG